MAALGKREALILYLGDLILLYAALWVSFVLRNIQVSDDPSFIFDTEPFLILMAIWVVVFYIAGLYDRHTLIFSRKLPSTLIRAQLINTAIAVTFFYLIPSYNIAPKTILILFLIISTLFIGWWRLYGIAYLASGRKQRALLIGEGPEVEEFMAQINDNERSGIRIIERLEPKDMQEKESGAHIRDIVRERDVRSIIMVLRGERIDGAVGALYDVLFSNVRFIDFHKIYEAVFNRVPLSFIDHAWVLQHVSTRAHFLYDSIKRTMDLLFGLAFGMLSLPVYPFVWLAIKIDDGGPVFIRQERVGERNSIIRIIKFRTMPASGKNGLSAKGDTRITRVGGFLRKARIDELPQLWNIVGGGLALIGPRPEIPDLVRIYEKEIPHYGMRHIIKPGLSGWAQIHDDNVPRVMADVAKTKAKLSYDLYYIKNRSLALDIEIVLKTIRTVLSRNGV